MSKDRKHDFRSSGLVMLLGIGLVIRLLFFVLAGRLEPHGDEANYLYLGLLWNRFGFYSDAVEYLWPPIYPFLVAKALSLFGSGGPAALKLLQIVASVIIGSCTMLIAQQLFGPRAARIAGLVWCGYLPLIGFTHYLWPESLFLTFFLSSFYMILYWWLRNGPEDGLIRPLLLAGTLFGVAVLVKEVGLYLVPIHCGAIIWRARNCQYSHQLGFAGLYLLSFTVVVMPWTLRNLEVYGRFVPVGATLGKNLFMGVNGGYRNLDFPHRIKGKIRQANHDVVERLTGRAPEGWRQSNQINVIDRSAENVSRGLRFARDNLVFYLRSRIKKMADWSSPMSFYLRHYSIDRYQGILVATPVRRILIIVALVIPIAVLIGAIPGLFLALDDRSVRILLLTVIGYFFLTGALINASTRYRVPIEPLLIALSGGFYSGANRPWFGKTILGWVSVGSCSVLLFFWYLNWRELAAFIGIIW